MSLVRKRRYRTVCREPEQTVRELKVSRDYAARVLDGAFFWLRCGSKVNT